MYRGTGTTCPTNVQPNSWGCGYVYGFRVPLLVVSEYTSAGYVSGALPSPDEVPEYEHDFGSILAFIEHNFNLLPIDQGDSTGYADLNALDSANGNIPLSDFFKASNQRNFTTIQTLKDAGYFRNYSVYNPGYIPTGPDDDSEVD